jgi:hypothetical protein
LNSDFKYEKIQLYYKQPIIIGPLGRTNVTVGENLGTIPLGLLSVIPGIKLILLSKIPLATLIFMSLYLTSMTVQWDHNFEGVFSPEFHL